MDDPLLPRPSDTYDVKCPSCKHVIDNHLSPDWSSDSNPCQAFDNGRCGCLWTPNDIAWSLLYSGLTKMASPTPITNRIKRSLPW